MSNDTTRQRRGMWEKLKEKNEIEREHESNFKAGRINIHERNLHRTGIRGRKRYIYYACLYLIGIICFINFVMLCIMLTVLKIDKSGMESLSLFKSGLVRWMHASDLQHVVIKPGEIGSFAGQNLSIVGRNDAVKLSQATVGGSFASFGPNETLFQSKNGVRIVSTDVNKTILHITDREVVWDVPAETKNLDTTNVVSHKITSGIEKNFNCQGKVNVTIRGNENVFVDSGRLSFAAPKGNVIFRAGETSELMFKASEGYRFHNVTKVDSVTKPSSEKKYRLCQCRNSKQLFKIEVKPNIACSNAIAVC